MADQGNQLHPSTQRFVDILQAAVNRSLNFVEENEFGDSYKKIFTNFKQIESEENPPLAGSSNEAKKLRNLMHEYVMEEVKEMIDNVVVEENLDMKFRTLEKMKLSSNHNKNVNAWRPPGNAEKHMIPFIAAYKTDEKLHLQNLVKKEREKLEILKNRLSAKRDKAEILDASIKSKVKILQEQLQGTSENDQLSPLLES